MRIGGRILLVAATLASSFVVGLGGSGAAAFAGEISLLNGGGPDGVMSAVDHPLKRSEAEDVAVLDDGTIAVTGGTYTYLLGADGSIELRDWLATEVAVSASGDTLLGSAFNIIYEYDPATGESTVLAGQGVDGYANGPVEDSLVANPKGLVAWGDAIIFAESTTSMVRRIENGMVSRVAGTGATSQFGGDGGNALAAWLSRPSDVAVDESGQIYVVDRLNHAIRLIALDNTITTIAGQGQSAGFAGDGGPAVGALLDRPGHVVIDADGDVLFTDVGNNRIRKVSTATGVITTVAGTGVAESSGDGGLAVDAGLTDLGGLALDGQGRIVFTEGNRVRRFVDGGVIETIAGTGFSNYGIEDGPVWYASLDDRGSIAVDVDDSLLVGSNNTIRRVEGDRIGLVAGTAGVDGVSGDGGPAADATFATTAMVVDDAGNTYVSDVWKNVVRKIAPDGTISTFAGDGTRGFSGDGGPATEAQLNGPIGLDVGPDGSVYIADDGRVRKVAPDGTISTIAGNGVSYPYAGSGDGGPALEASLGALYDVAVDSVGNVWLNGSAGVRRVGVDGVITTVAEIDRRDSMRLPQSIVVDAADNVFASLIESVVMITPAGEVRTVAISVDGWPESPEPGATAATVSVGFVNDMAISSDGDLYLLSSDEVVYNRDESATQFGLLYRIEGIAAAELEAYVPADPAPLRLLDTREAGEDRLAAGGERRVVVAGRAGVEADATAVVVNLTAVRPGGDGYLTVYPCGDAPSPPTSNLNYSPGYIVANAAIVPLGDDGAICVSSSADTDVLVDVQGWYTAATDYTTTTPFRLVDSRIGLGTPTQLDAREEVRIDVAGVAPIPTGTGAAAMNVTAVRSADRGYITMYPCGDRPYASSLNTWPGHAIANLVITDLADTGEVCVYSSTDTEIIIDVHGWFPTQSSYYPLTPLRVEDTRTSGTPVAGGTELEVDVRGGSIPDLARVAVVNVTAVGAQGPAFVTVYPCGQPRPVVSNNNTSADRTVATAVVAELSDEGTICVYSSITSHIIVDVVGWQSFTRVSDPPST